MKRNTLIIVIWAIYSVGCTSLSTFQTAQVLEENKTTFGAAVSAFPHYDFEGDDEDGVGVDEAVLGGTIEGFYRTSISSTFDVGLKAYLIGGIVDAKYQFLDQETVDMAFDLGIGYQQISTDEESYRYIDFYPTLLVTFHLAEKFSLTFAPKVIARHVTGHAKRSNLAGGTMMLKIGPFMPEIGYYNIDGTRITSFGVGIMP